MRNAPYLFIYLFTDLWGIEHSPFQMFWDSVCPSFTGNTLSSTNWLSPLLGGHCCLRSSIQKFKKVVHILCSPRQRPGSQGIIFRVRLIWRHKAYTKGWKQVTIPFLLSDGFQSFIKLLHTKEREREREREKKNSVIQLIFCIKHHMAAQKLLLYWLSEPQHCCKIN